MKATRLQFIKHVLLPGGAYSNEITSPVYDITLHAHGAAVCRGSDKGVVTTFHFPWHMIAVAESIDLPPDAPGLVVSDAPRVEVVSVTPAPEKRPKRK